MTNQLLPPLNWEDFELLCHGLWSELLSDPETKMHGRRGQSQNGVDIYGYDHSGGTRELVAIQCKGKDNYLDRNVTEKELREVVRKASLFQPVINKFILSATGMRDTTVQAFTRTVNSENISAGRFPVSMWCWQDIAEQIQNYPALLRKFYPEIFINPNLTRTQSSLDFFLPLSHDHEQRVAALFEVDDIKGEIHEDFRHEVRDFILEIASNAFRHGQARKLEIKLMPQMILIKDNGTKFDAIMKAGLLNTDISMQGLKYIMYFLNQYEDELSAKYTYDHKYKKNIITLNFKNPIVRLKPDRCLLSISDFMGRAEAQSAGDSQMFAEECQIYTINIHRRHFMMSSLFVYLRRVVDRLPEGKRIRVMLPNKHHKAIVDGWFDSQVVEVIAS